MTKGTPIDVAIIQTTCASIVDVIGQEEYITDVLEGIRNHDDYTFAHSVRVSVLLTLLCRAIGMNRDELVVAAQGGFLHDAGKMRINDRILKKPGKPSPEEWIILQGHVADTLDILRHTNIPKMARLIAEQHHERLDGSGYPNKLRGKEIDDLARMAAIVDVFSALTDDRPYSRALSADKALRLMETEMAEQLDMLLLRAFRRVLLSIQRYKKK